MPFTDNGAFLEALLSFLPGYANECANHALSSSPASDYLACFHKRLDRAAGRSFGRGSTERVARFGDGLVRLVPPSAGFNSHRWFPDR